MAYCQMSKLNINKELLAAICFKTRMRALTFLHEKGAAVSCLPGNEDVKGGNLHVVIGSGMVRDCPSRGQSGGCFFHLVNWKLKFQVVRKNVPAGGAKFLSQEYWKIILLH